MTEGGTDDGRAADADGGGDETAEAPAETDTAALENGGAAADGDVNVDVDFAVAVIGGGPAGCAAGVFTARYGLETIIFDRGPSSLRRCASLENYLGFPCGIEIETFLELAQDHAEQAGCQLRNDLVESVSRLEDGEGFRLEPQEGESVTARFVVAASKYDGSYLRGLDDDESMFVTQEHDGGTAERFDRDYPDDDGTTPVDGLYVAGPLAGSGDQAIIAAGHGATVARTLIRELREEAGFWGKYAGHYDWRRKVENRREEWVDPERWVELFEESAPDDYDPITVRRLAETYADEYGSDYVEPDVAAQRAERGQRRLAAALEDEIILEAVDDEAILERARELEDSPSDG
ncbi:thioredoxin reductase [Halopiger xanaduensis]|uniref:FAD-dependent pyridine nucleotide-disulfide oxidoreductase n=1 Tax=Halopiger xanaduensis (strain DSM 18323 / JCM 14033 / SH-6) TaxID=797210 RepID=F8DB30_HALXS|nr:thioredoxin reductase [Halopiger xanaduensis]AEH38255.1 FAD-dependent pyridine nucleotide-disulfide oxidoreductase [Halopiger xanaduensis SH-6]